LVTNLAVIFGFPAAPSRLHAGRVPVMICFACSCGVGWQALYYLDISPELINRPDIASICLLLNFFQVFFHISIVIFPVQQTYQYNVGGQYCIDKSCFIALDV